MIQKINICKMLVTFTLNPFTNSFVLSAKQAILIYFTLQYKQL